MDEAGYSRVEIIGSSKDASSKDRDVAQADTWGNAAEGLLAWRVPRG